MSDNPAPPPNRRQRRAAQFAKRPTTMGESATERRTFRLDITLALVLALVALAVVFRPPQTRESAVIWLCVMLLLGIYPALHVADQVLILNNKFRARALAIGVWVCMIAVFGVYVWPPIIAVSPNCVSFEIISSTNTEVYTFRLMNKSDDDVYVAEFDFIVEEPKVVPDDLVLDVPKASRKSIADYRGGVYVDMIGFLCRDTSNRPAYVISVNRLSPHETREITITSKAKAKFYVKAKTGFFSAEPMPSSINAKGEGSYLRFNGIQIDRKGCIPFGFLMDDSRRGMYWFNHPYGDLNRSPY